MSTTPPEIAPSHVVVDGHDGFTWAQDEAGQPFTIEAARDLAARWNARMKPEHARFRVYALTLVDVPDPAADQERQAWESAARLARYARGDVRYRLQG